MIDGKEEQGTYKIQLIIPFIAIFLDPQVVVFCASFPSLDANSQATVNRT